MIAILMLLCVVLVMWLVQSAILMRAGMPLRLRIDSRGAPPLARNGGRITTQVCLFTAILIYPLLRGDHILHYYGKLLPRDASVSQFIQGAAAAALCLSVMFLVWLLTDRVEIKSHLSRRKCVKRMTLLIPTALFGAFVEELLFRGVFMADLLRSNIPTWLVVFLSALVFAIAHYVRAVKRKWTFPGHVALGLVLSIAYLQTGSLWLAMGLHAGGIFMIMGTRPFFWYKGPAWLTGASIFPFAGAIGIMGLGVLTTFVLQHFPR